jgi:phage head maturation protease
MPDDDFVTQHIEVRSQEKRILPITETGYRSHFMNGAEALAEFENDPVAFVMWWLDEAAQDPTWKRKEEEDRQGSLF